MHYLVYILQSVAEGRYYIGSCEDVDGRLARHNAGQVRATKYGVPWRVIYQEGFETRQDAYRREMQIKRYKGGEAFKRLVNNL